MCFLTMKSKVAFCRQEDPKYKSQEQEGIDSEGLTRNSIKNRVSIISYAANNPIEDRFNAIQLKNLDGFLVEVLDGHGGFQVAEYASKKLHIYFDERIKQLEGKSLSEDDKIIESINFAFTSVESDFYKLAKDSFDSGNISYLYVGACVLVIIIHNNKLYVAQCGDSKAKLFRKEESYSSGSGGYKPIKLTQTLNAGSKKEQMRLKAEYSDDDIYICKRGDKACYVKGRLQPTRSIGDFYLKHREFNSETESSPSLRRKIKNFNGPYIKYLPMIQVYELDKDDRYVVLATDGLWDELDGRDVANVIKENDGDKGKILDGLFHSAMYHAARIAGMSYEDLLKVPLGRNRRSLHDDITVMVVDLKNQRSV